MCGTQTTTPTSSCAADIINQSWNCFHCVYTQDLRMPFNIASGNHWQQIHSMNDRNYLESLLYDMDSIALTAIVNIKSQEYQNVITYVKIGSGSCLQEHGTEYSEISTLKLSRSVFLITLLSGFCFPCPLL